MAFVIVLNSERNVDSISSEHDHLIEGFSSLDLLPLSELMQCHTKQLCIYMVLYILKAIFRITNIYRDPTVIGL